jgi:hypothetical protein
MIGTSKMCNNNSNKLKDRLFIYTNSEYSEIIEDLIITGGHSLLVDEFKKDEKEKTEELFREILLTDNKYLLPACIDTKSKLYEKEGIFDVYHIALDNDNDYLNYGIYANGLLVESCSKWYLKNFSGMTFNLK